MCVRDSVSACTVYVVNVCVCVCVCYLVFFIHSKIYAVIVFCGFFMLFSILTIRIIKSNISLDVEIKQHRQIGYWKWRIFLQLILLHLCENCVDRVDVYVFMLIFSLPLSPMDLLKTFKNYHVCVILKLFKVKKIRRRIREKKIMRNI